MKAPFAVRALIHVLLLRHEWLKWLSSGYIAGTPWGGGTAVGDPHSIEGPGDTFWVQGPPCWE